MTAICKTILIHNTNLQHLLDYGSDQEKTSVSRNGLSDVLYYGANPAKTLSVLDNGDKELLVTGVLCQPETAVLDFGITREKYLASHEGERYASFEFLDKRTNSKRLVQKETVTAIHLIQSFQETDLNPRTVHQVGIELCEKLGVQAVVDTHMNKEHLHNHIIINAYLPDGVSKLCMDSAKRLQIRELSDTIQRSYGIEITFADPRTQLFQSKGRGTYREWDAVRKNISWKEEMKEFIKEALSVSENKEDFLTIMQDNGYAIANQTVDSVTWWNKSHTRKIRDTTLGMEYKLGTLFPGTDHSPEYDIGNEAKVPHKPSKPISIARYDWNGRRRSDLEILIRKALEILRRVGNRYQPKTVLTSLPTTRKIEMMEQALSSIQKLGLEQKSDLELRLDTTGAKLNHTKSQLTRMEGKKQFYDLVEPLLKDMQNTKRIVDSIEYWPGGTMPDLMLSSFSEKEIHKIRAERCPMSSSQKRELYLALKKHPEYSLSGDGFSGVSSMDAEEILNFFRGACQKPELLKNCIDAEMNKVYQKRTQYLKDSFSRPLYEYQIQEVKKLLPEEHQNIDFTALTQFDLININNCYGSQPFSEPPISIEQQHRLSCQLNERGLSLNRELQYILPSEYEQLQDYLDGLTPKKPDLLKSCEPAEPIDIEKLQIFMDAKGIATSIPLSVMTKKDYQKLFGYVISLGQTPECLMKEPEDLSPKFFHSIQTDGITEKKQILLLQLRSQMQELAKLGIDPFHPNNITEEISAFRHEYEALSWQKSQLSHEYRSLLELSQELTYAESTDFLYGSLFDEKVHEKPQITISQQKEMPPNKNLDTMDYDL